METPNDPVTITLGELKEYQEARAEVDGLRTWKNEALKVLNNLKFEEIANEIGAKLDSDISPQVLPFIRSQSERNDNLREKLQHQTRATQEAATFWHNRVLERIEKHIPVEMNKHGHPIDELVSMVVSLLECKIADAEYTSFRQLTDIEQLRKSLDESKAETASAIEFMQTEMGWEYFRNEMLWKPDETEFKNASANNAKKLRNFLQEKSHGIEMLKRLAKQLAALQLCGKFFATEKRFSLRMVSEREIEQQNAEYDAAYQSIEECMKYE